VFRKIVSLMTACTIIFMGSSCDKQKNESKEDVKIFSSFFNAQGTEISSENTVYNLIGEKTGACCELTWLNKGDNIDDIVEKMIMKNDYPDYIYAGNKHQRFIEAGAYIPLDSYIEKNENLKNYFTEEEWDRVREDDGHIYIIPVFSKEYMYDTNTLHNDEAFWIQVKVLRWAGYPEINTLDEYFDLIEAYIKENPVAENGEKNIGYEILNEGYLYFCLENPPQFLDGYPNDGSCIVDRETHKVIDYNTTETARLWFRKLNEEYHKGIIDPECFVMTAQQYYDKLATGNVIGMVDQRWNFQRSVENLTDECSYVPLGITIREGIEEHYHSSVAFDVSQGLGVSVSCSDPEGAVKFINDLISPEIHTLRFWGIEGKDYTVGEDGIFYLTDEQSGFAQDADYKFNERCQYDYFPHYKGMDQDGKNAYSPDYQPSEFFKKLSPIMQECFSAYDVQTYVELLNRSGENAPWYPMWSYTNTFTPDTPHGKAKEDMDAVKHEYLPRVVMSDDFDAEWERYMEAYEKCNVKAYISALQAEVDRCVKLAE